MIKEKNYKDRESIEQDKENFKNYALLKNYALEDILNFMEYYENLISFEENLKHLKGRLKNERI